MHGFGFGMGFGWVFMILFWVAVIVAIVYLVRFMLDRGGSNSTSDALPEEILKERFARGELSEQEYRKQLRILKEL